MAITSYGTVSGADAYALSVGNAEWATLSEADRQAALVRASAYIDSYVRRPIGEDGKCWWTFDGERTGGWDQMRQWPRKHIDGLPDDVVPTGIEYATYEAAMREGASAGSLMPDVIPGSIVKKEKVDVLEVEYAVDAKTTANMMQPSIPLVEAMLAQFLVRRCNNGFYVATA